jgi:hypothetical protein
MEGWPTGGDDVDSVPRLQASPRCPRRQVLRPCRPGRTRQDPGARRPQRPARAGGLWRPARGLGRALRCAGRSRSPGTLMGVAEAGRRSGRARAGNCKSRAAPHPIGAAGSFPPHEPGPRARPSFPSSVRTARAPAPAFPSALLSRRTAGEGATDHEKGRGGQSPRPARRSVY